MDVRILKVSKSELKAFPDSERLLVVVGGHIRNEIACLQKLLLRAVHADDATLMEQDGNASQTSLLLRLLAGKLYEAWRFLARNYEKKLSPEYRKHLPDDRLAAYDSVKAYFTNPSDFIIKILRNRLAFHYDNDGLLQAIDSLDDAESLSIYITNVEINSFYGLSDSLAMRAMLSTSSELIPTDAVTHIADEILTMAERMSYFLDAAIGTALNRNLPASSFDTAELESIDVVEGTGLPYFYRWPDAT